MTNTPDEAVCRIDGPDGMAAQKIAALEIKVELLQRQVGEIMSALQFAQDEFNKVWSVVPRPDTCE